LLVEPANADLAAAVRAAVAVRRCCAELGWRTLAGEAPAVQGVGILAYWGLLFAVAALILYRRAGRRVTA
jgi:hypothetical protein